MTRHLIALVAALTAAPVLADTVIATHTIRAQTVLVPQDVQLADGTTTGAYRALDEVVGLETRVTLYAGRPIRMGDIGPPAIVERNALVPLLFRRGGLEIAADGRALARAGVGETVRVMNLQSRQAVTGRVNPDGTVIVGAANSNPGN